MCNIIHIMHVVDYVFMPLMSFISFMSVHSINAPCGAGNSSRMRRLTRAISACESVGGLARRGFPEGFAKGFANAFRKPLRKAWRKGLKSTRLYIIYKIPKKKSMNKDMRNIDAGVFAISLCVQCHWRYRCRAWS